MSEQSNADAGVTADASKPVNDVSHLVRRVKRTAGEDEEECAKKIKSTDGSPVRVATNGNETNGHATDADIPSL